MITISMNTCQCMYIGPAGAVEVSFNGILYELDAFFVGVFDIHIHATFMKPIQCVDSLFPQRGRKKKKRVEKRKGRES